MKLRMISAGLVALCLCAATAGAASLEVGLNDKSLQAQVFMPISQDAYGTSQVGVRGLYNDDDRTRLFSGEIDFLGKPGNVPGLTAGVGTILWGGKVGSGTTADILSVGVGARASFAPPQLMGAGVEGKFFYGPKILTAGDSERVIESSLRGFYAFIPKARCFVEYQRIHVDFDGGDANIDNDFRVGFEAKF